MSDVPTDKQIEDLFWQEIANRHRYPGRSRKLREAVHAVLAQAEWRRTAAINYARRMEHRIALLNRARDVS